MEKDRLYKYTFLGQPLAFRSVIKIKLFFLLDYDYSIEYDCF